MFYYSSEDEINRWVDETPPVKRQSKQQSVGSPLDSSEDEFEKEMMSELNSQMSNNYSVGQRAAGTSKEQGKLTCGLR